MLSMGTTLKVYILYITKCHCNSGKGGSRKNSEYHLPLWLLYYFSFYWGHPEVTSVLWSCGKSQWGDQQNCIFRWKKRKSKNRLKPNNYFDGLFAMNYRITSLWASQTCVVYMSATLRANMNIIMIIIITVSSVFYLYYYLYINVIIIIIIWFIIHYNHHNHHCVAIMKQS